LSVFSFLRFSFSFLHFTFSFRSDISPKRNCTWHISLHHMPFLIVFDIGKGIRRWRFKRLFSSLRLSFKDSAFKEGLGTGGKVAVVYLAVAFLNRL